MDTKTDVAADSTAAEERAAVPAVRQQVYELLYLVPLHDNAEERTAIHSRVAEIITADGGRIITSREFARQRLAYPIGTHTAGEYELVEFAAPTTALQSITRELGLEPRLLRYIVTVKSARVRSIGANVETIERTQSERAVAAKAAAAMKAGKESEQQPAAASDTPPEAIADLDEKLDEILGKEMV
ncbi:MAG: 30S ribosomal protein S6 [bacterium]|nr:30S ribosomal protein S6 [bacterium]